MLQQVLRNQMAIMEYLSRLPVSNLNDEIRRATEGLCREFAATDALLAVVGPEPEAE